MDKRKVEVFTAGCSICQPTVEMVKSMACPDCEVVVYNVADPAQKEALAKAQNYGINKLPSVVVNGKLLPCCQNKGVSETELRKAGVGQPL
jgi:hypothetical protein